LSLKIMTRHHLLPPRTDTHPPLSVLWLTNGPSLATAVVDTQPQPRHQLNLSQLRESAAEPAAGEHATLILTTTISNLSTFLMLTTLAFWIINDVSHQMEGTPRSLRRQQLVRRRLNKAPLGLWARTGASTRRLPSGTSAKCMIFWVGGGVAFTCSVPYLFSFIAAHHGVASPPVDVWTWRCMWLGVQVLLNL